MSLAKFQPVAITLICCDQVFVLAFDNVFKTSSNRLISHSLFLVRL